MVQTAPLGRRFKGRCAMIAGTAYSRRPARPAPRYLRRLPVPQTTDWADVQVVGIPRALLFYRFGVLWTTFFESIGRTVVVSDPTDKAIADGGDRLSVDECCLASKVFIGTWKAMRAAATPSSCPAIRRATTAAGSARSSSRPPIWCVTPSATTSCASSPARCKMPGR